MNGARDIVGCINRKSSRKRLLTSPVGVPVLTLICMHPEGSQPSFLRLWKYRPANNSDRDGQHTGVCAKNVVKFAPVFPRADVNDIAFIDPNSMSYDDSEYKYEQGH